MATAHKSAADTATDDPWLGINAAVEFSGKAKTTILTAALDGKVRWQRVAGRRVFHRDDLNALSNDEDE